MPKSPHPRSISELVAAARQLCPETVLVLRGTASGRVRIDLVSVPRHRRRRGDGTRVMELVCRTADRLGWDLVLQVSSVFGTPTDVLVAWYSSFGFASSDGGTMRRAPYAGRFVPSLVC